MAVQASESITLTDVATGGTFLLSTANIINFLVSGANTLITYVNNRDTVISQLVTEAVGVIDAATGGRTQAVTLSTGVIYINSDRIIFLDDDSGNVTVTYDTGVNVPSSFLVSEAAVAIELAAGNLFGIQELPLLNVRYLNNLRIHTMVSDGGTATFIAYDAKGTALANVYARDNPGVIQGVINAL